MRIHKQLFVTLAVVALSATATAQTATTAVGRAASAAVTPGDQDMGRNPNNRTGGLMGADGTTTTTADGTNVAMRAPRRDRH